MVSDLDFISPGGEGVYEIQITNHGLKSEVQSWIMDFGL